MRRVSRFPFCFLAEHEAGVMVRCGVLSDGHPCQGSIPLEPPSRASTLADRHNQKPSSVRLWRPSIRRWNAEQPCQRLARPSPPNLAASGCKLSHSRSKRTEHDEPRRCRADWPTTAAELPQSQPRSRDTGKRRQNNRLGGGRRRIVSGA